MTLVHFDLRRGNFVTPTVGSVWLAPVKRVHVNETPDYIALPDPVEYPLTNGQVTLDLRPNTVDWAWVCFEAVDAGVTRTFAVPESNTTLDYGDLVDIDPTTLTPSAEPIAAWWAVANANVINAEVDSNGILIFTQYDGNQLGPFNIKGPQGDKGDVGPAGMQWRGIYSSTIDYVLNDAVSYQGTSWFAAVNPPVGATPSLQSIYWQQFAVQGSQGNPGPPNSLTATATGLPSGSSPTAVVTGVSPTQQVEFGIPAGAMGPQGSQGDMAPSTTVSWGTSTFVLSSTTPTTRRATLTGNPTFTVSNGPANISFTNVITVIQDATGNRSVTWPTNVIWDEGIKPIVPTAPNSKHEYELFWNGAEWHGYIAGQNLA